MESTLLLGSILIIIILVIYFLLYKHTTNIKQENFTSFTNTEGTKFQVKYIRPTKTSNNQDKILIDISNRIKNYHYKIVTVKSSFPYDGKSILTVPIAVQTDGNKFQDNIDSPHNDYRVFLIWEKTVTSGHQLFQVWRVRGDDTKRALFDSISEGIEKYGNKAFSNTVYIGNVIVSLKYE
jgi:hypothetical protein